MTVTELRAASPCPPGLSVPLQALWKASRGDWDGAHQLVQDEESREAAWVHAYLHRQEGDLGNAGYWYGRAGRPPCRAPLPEEWQQIAEALLLEHEP